MWTLLRDAKRTRCRALAIVVLVMAPWAMAMKGDFSQGHTRYAKRMPQTREHILLGRQVGLSRVIEERNLTDNVTRQIIYGARSPLWQLLSDGTSQYFHEDPRGNVVALTEGVGPPTESAGDVLERVTYDPYGKPLFQDAANVDKRDPVGVLVGASDFQNTLLFGGLWYDPASSLRSAGLNDDFGGWYMAAAQYYNPNTGRHTTRAFLEGDPDRPVITGRAAYPELNPYAASGVAPVNASGQRGNHELGHALGTREKGSGRATGRRTYEPIRMKAVDAQSTQPTQSEDKVPRKKPGRTTYQPIGAQTPGSSLTDFEGTTVHLSGHGVIPSGELLVLREDTAQSIPGIEHEDIGIFDEPESIPGIEHEDIGIFDEPESIPGIEHEDIGIFAVPGTIPGVDQMNDIGIIPGSGPTRKSGGYCYDPPWSPPMCCGWSKCGEPGCKLVEVCVYF